MYLSFRWMLSILSCTCRYNWLARKHFCIVYVTASASLLHQLKDFSEMCSFLFLDTVKYSPLHYVKPWEINLGVQTVYVWQNDCIM